MKKLSIILVLAAGVTIVGCSDVKRKPGSVYMPDMAYSRAYETYADHSNLAEQGIFYNSQPVSGTIARDRVLPFSIKKDAAGDTVNYYAARQVQNPLPPLNEKEMKEVERLYLVNCGICHGPKLDGNGPIYKGGEGPYPAKPAQLVGDAKYESMPEGQMYYSVEYGKNLMGSYASQLSSKQRWSIIHYIKAKQGKTSAAPAAAATPTAAQDSTGTEKK
ncbi:c-type cytochrome [Filimonas effusa]|uniref:Cytochrome c n=1 Tax=Filimonas effusa TaxID=2508721 RepID=A0A4Q1D1K0_9BACT|nr:cytochrome c [Filimonas effusa]RXK80981.1 cytochrome c [Filimonas effusa]